MTNMLINNLAYRQMCCSSCGVVYFFPDKWCDQARVEGKSWKCPNGHGQWFGEAEVDKLRRERDRLKQQVAQRDDEVSRQRDMRQGVERRLNATVAWSPGSRTALGMASAHAAPDLSAISPAT